VCELFLLLLRSELIMIDPLDYERSIMELQLKKQKLEEEIADIDNVLKWMNEQKQELLNTTDDLTTEIFKDILGKN